MRKRPIIMGYESVRAILEERKTQSRRVIKPQPKFIDSLNVPFKTDDANPKGIINCPYGKVGDRLWVRETWGVGCRPDPNSGWVDGIEYKADESYLDDIESLPLRVIDDQDLEKYQRDGWNSPIFMPRWASRITLEITDIRVERVQDITEEDAILEGISRDFAYECNGWVPSYTDPDSGGYADYIAAYRTLWDYLNAKRGYPWESNPWVWVVSFKVVKV